MSRRTWIALLALAGLVAPAAASGFNVIVPVGDPTRGLPASPDAYLPPFDHWDFREFSTCKVPFTIHAQGTPDVAGVGAFGAVDAAANQWSFQGESRIALERRPATTATNTFGRDGENVVTWTAGVAANEAMFPARDDVDLVPGGVGQDAADAGGPRLQGIALNRRIIAFGPDGEANSAPVGDDIFIGQGDIETLRRLGIDVEAGIYAGPNGRVDTLANNGRVFAVTFIYSDIDSGVIEEADILFNDRDIAWSTTEIAPRNPTYAMDVWSVAVHEFGHLLGLHHVGFAISQEADPVMTSMRGETYRYPGVRRSVQGDDAAGVEFLYSPDLGDAPDPLVPPNVGTYPTEVRSAGAGRMLNGAPLDAPLLGAVHLFDDYEFLGLGSTGECAPADPDGDAADDGVDFLGGRSFNPGVAKDMDIKIAYLDLPVRYNLKLCVGGDKDKQNCTGSSDCPGGVCTDDLQARLYLNGWCDWNANGDFEDPGEKFINDGPINPFSPGHGFTAGRVGPGRRSITARYSVVPPLDAEPQVYCRFRLDRGEDAGELNNVNGDLSGSRGVAQWGEVEDYRLIRAAAGAGLRWEPSEVCLLPSPGETGTCTVSLDVDLGDGGPILVGGLTGAVQVSSPWIRIDSAEVVAPGLWEAQVDISPDGGSASVFAVMDPGDPGLGCNNWSVAARAPVLEIAYTVLPEAPLGEIATLDMSAAIAQHVPNAASGACEPVPLEDLGIAREDVEATLRIVSDDESAPVLTVQTEVAGAPALRITADDGGGSGVDPATLAVTFDTDVVGLLSLDQGADLTDLPAGTNLASSFQYDAERGEFAQMSPWILEPGEHALSIRVRDRAGNFALWTGTVASASPPPAPAAPVAPAGEDGCGCRVGGGGGYGSSGALSGTALLLLARWSARRRRAPPAREVAKLP